MGNKKILITGMPGIGKTTLLKRIKDLLSEKSLSMGGVFCPEIRTHGQRSGFAIMDILSGHEGVLACKGCAGPKIGKYGVNLEDLNQIGVKALKNALKSSEYILIDEIAPMELKSFEFSQIINEIFDSSKTVIAVIHKKSNNKLIESIKNKENIILFDINVTNRDLIYQEIVELLDL